MNSHLTYLMVDIFAVSIPLLFSFHHKLQFNKYWKPALISILVTSLIFILWDVYFTHLGIWGFNKDYLTGLYLFNLPIEEILFFFCIPYSCLFTYHCFKKLIKPLNFVNPKFITIILSAFLLILGVYFYDRLYTSVTFTLLVLVLILLQWKLKVNWLNRFYLTYFVLLIPFVIVNGVLTGTGLNEPIVWYNLNEIIGLRLFTIPFEDVFYGLLLIISNVSLFEKLSAYLTIKIADKSL